MGKKNKFVDPRRKLLVLLTMNILLLSLSKGESVAMLRFGAGFLSLLICAWEENTNFRRPMAMSIWDATQLGGFCCRVCRAFPPCPWTF